MQAAKWSSQLAQFKAVFIFSEAQNFALAIFGEFLRLRGFLRRGPAALSGRRNGSVV